MGNGGYSNQVSGKAEETYVDFDGNGKIGTPLYRDGAWYIQSVIIDIRYYLGVKICSVTFRR